MHRARPIPPSPSPEPTARQRRRRLGAWWRHDFRTNPVRRYLVSVALGIVLPALALAWILGSVVLMRTTSQLVHAGSAEVASYVEGLLRQQAADAADAEAGRSSADVPARERGAASPGLAAPAEPAKPEADTAWVPYGGFWERFGNNLLANPRTLSVRVYDATGTVVYADNSNLIGMRPAPDDALARAFAGERATRLDNRLMAPEVRTYGVLVPLKVSGFAGGAVEVIQNLGPLRSEMVVARWLVTLGVAIISVGFLAALVPLSLRLAERSFLDPVTGLPNRRYLEDAAAIVLDRSASRNQGAAVVLLDLDRFKAVNDALGRRQGDRILRDLAHRLDALVRSGDYVARLGGDEFAMVLTDVDESAAGAAVARVAKAVAQPYPTGDRDVRLEASVGVTLFPRDGLDLATLLQRAESAMYRAKSARVPFEFFRHGDSAYTLHGLYLESDLRDAIENGGLELAYQPICRLDDGQIVAVEALARWNHPERGAVPPGLFVPLAEDTGLVRQLDQWTLRAASTQLSAWAAAGSNLRLSVNLSAQTVSDPGLPEHLAALLERTGAPPEQLVLEVTERIAIDDIESSAGILERVRAMGVRIALDDFGKGYSSLGTLDRLPIGYLKIDAGFVRGIGRKAKEEHLIRAIAGFSRGIGIPLVAEGIEDEEQRAWLLSEGVRYGQGYLLARPGRPQQMPALRHLVRNPSSTLWDDAWADAAHDRSPN